MALSIMDPFFLIFLIVCGLAAFTDFLIYKIPNEIIAFLFTLFFISFFMKAGFDWQVLKTPLMVFGISLFVCFVLYAVKMLGAGDAKLIAVVSLWVTDYNPLLFFILMTFFGGILGLLYLKLHDYIDTVRFFLIKKLSNIAFIKGYLKEKTQTPARDLKNKSKVTLPYGVAVFAGVLLMLKFY